MINFFYNQKPVTQRGWLTEYKVSEFNSPTRSTVPLLDALRREPPAAFLRDLLEAGGSNPETTNLHLEYQVRPGKGRGKASHTDLMAIDATPAHRALAIEAKWTEPRYETVTEWLGQGTSPENRRLVLSGWLEMLEPHADGRLASDECGKLIYQMVHRAASAASVCAPGGRPVMVYLMFECDEFGASHLDDYRTDLQCLRSTIGNFEGFPFFLATVTIQATQAFREIADLKRGDSETGKVVRSSLAHDRPPLFEFDVPKIEKI